MAIAAGVDAVFVGLFSKVIPGGVKQTGEVYAAFETGALYFQTADGEVMTQKLWSNEIADTAKACQGRKMGERCTVTLETGANGKQYYRGISFPAAAVRQAA